MEVSVSAKTCGQTLGCARVRALAAINTLSGLSSMAALLTSAHLSVRTSPTLIARVFLRCCWAFPREIQLN